MEANGQCYKDMYDCVVVDEKWFYMICAKEQYYMVPTEIVPERSVKNKDKIPKVMFMCAVSHPCFVPATNQWFDGKLGIWPFANLVPVQWSCVNRPAGTPEWKYFNVTREVYEAFILEKVVPAMKAKMRHRRDALIYIQQDNTSTHISNAAFQASMT
jgi:hypothetical protein